MTVTFASPGLRDEFLRALDDEDRAVAVRLARNLINCANPLPGMVCDQLGLPAGSTYASAAGLVLVQSQRSE